MKITKCRSVGIIGAAVVALATGLLIRATAPGPSRRTAARHIEVVTASGLRLPDLFHGLASKPVNDFRRYKGQAETIGCQTNPGVVSRLLSGLVVHAESCLPDAQCSGSHWEDADVECVGELCDDVYDRGRQNMSIDTCTGLRETGQNGCLGHPEACPCEWETCDSCS